MTMTPSLASSDTHGGHLILQAVDADVGLQQPRAVRVRLDRDDLCVRQLVKQRERRHPDMSADINDLDLTAGQGCPNAAR